MSWEMAGVLLSALVLVMQGVYMYTLAKTKLWVIDNFVTKGDFEKWFHLLRNGKTPHV